MTVAAVSGAKGLCESLVDPSKWSEFKDWFCNSYQGNVYNLKERLVRLRLCQSNIALFATLYFGDRIEDEFGDFQLGALNEIAEMEPGSALLKLWPREHAKTTLVSLIYVVWCISFRKALNIVIFSDTGEQAKEFLRNIKGELESNESLRIDFGDMVGDAANNNGIWNVQHIITANKVQVRAKSGKSQTRGLNVQLPRVVYWAGPIYTNENGEHYYSDKYRPPGTGANWPANFDLVGGYYVSHARQTVRPDLVILDDILHDKHVSNADLRKEMWRWFWQPLWNAIDHSAGRIIIIGTILHEDDLLSKLHSDIEKTEKWKKSRLPACAGFAAETITEDFIATAGPNKGKVVLARGVTRMRPLDVLWPARWGKLNPKTGQYLLWERRKEIGELLFAIEFLLTPLDDSVRIIRRDWIKSYIPPEILLPQENIRQLQVQLGYMLEGPPSDMVVCTAVDPAISEKDKADYTVVSTMGYSAKQQGFYILELTRRRLSVNETVLEIMKQVQKWNIQFGGTARDQFGRVLERGHGYEHLGVVIEVNAYQHSLYQAFKLMSKLMGYSPRIIQRHEHRDKRFRFMRMQPYFEDTRVHFPLNMVRGYENPDITEAIEELINIGVAAHDDCPDCIERNLSLLSRYAVYGGYEMNTAKFVHNLLAEDGEYV